MFEKCDNKFSHKKCMEKMWTLGKSAEARTPVIILKIGLMHLMANFSFYKIASLGFCVTHTGSPVGAIKVQFLK